MDEQPIPIVTGSHGLTGRQQVVRIPEAEIDEEGEPVPVRGKVMPSPCRRCQQLGQTCHDSRGMGFAGPCPGQQRDGGCLLAVVRAAEAAGVEWEFEVKVEGEAAWWDYVGPPLPGR